MTPVDTVRQWIGAMAAGTPHDDLAAPGFRYVGTPFGGIVAPPTEGMSSPDQAYARARAAGISLRFGEVLPGAPDRAWFEMVWSHDVRPGRGSAGLQWAVFTVEDGLVSEIHFFQEKEAARRYAERERGPR